MYLDEVVKSHRRTFDDFLRDAVNQFGHYEWRVGSRKVAIAKVSANVDQFGWVCDREVSKFAYDSIDDARAGLDAHIGEIDLIEKLRPIIGIIGVTSCDGKWHLIEMADVFSELGISFDTEKEAHDLIWKVRESK